MSFSLTKLTLGLSLALASPALATDLRISTGGESGTYIQIGKDIKRLVGEHGLQLNVESSQGSVQNLKRLLGYEGRDEGKYYQLAIIQEDVLADLKIAAKGNKTLSDIAGRVKVVLPLYNEEVHIFARKDSEATEMSHLIGTPISAGESLSGTYLTARLLFGLAGIPWDEEQNEPLGKEQGIDSLKSGLVDALFYVAGVPADLPSNYIKPEDELKLLEITNNNIFENTESPYVKVEIKKETYPWLENDVQTAAVRSLLVAFDYKKGENCEAIGKLTGLILENLDYLKEAGHKKWNEVDPKSALDRNDLYECARPAYASYE